MHLSAVLLLVILGAVGAWFGLVEDVELAFLGGLIAWAIAVVATFRGNFNPPDDIPADARLDPRTAIYTGMIVALLVLGAAAMWFGLIEDIKIGFLLGLIAWGAAVFVAFSGGAGPLDPKPVDDPEATVTSAGLQTAALALLIVGGLLAGAIGIWYALVEDIEIGFLLGMLVLAGTTLTAFRGKLAL